MKNQKHINRAINTKLEHFQKVEHLFESEDSVKEKYLIFHITR